MPPAHDDAYRDPWILDAFEPVIAADGALLYACTEWCGLLRSLFSIDFAEVE